VKYYLNVNGLKKKNVRRVNTLKSPATRTTNDEITIYLRWSVVAKR